MLVKEATGCTYLSACWLNMVTVGCSYLSEWWLQKVTAGCTYLSACWLHMVTLWFTYLSACWLHIVTAGKGRLSLCSTSTLMDLGWLWYFFQFSTLIQVNPPTARATITAHTILWKQTQFYSKTVYHWLMDVPPTNQKSDWNFLVNHKYLNMTIY